MDIYWIERGETKRRRGPLPVVEIISMVESGELQAETKAWHPGCDQWMPLQDLPALKSYFEGSSEEGEFDESSSEEWRRDEQGKSDETVDKSREIRVFVTPLLSSRLLARLFDMAVYLLMYFATIRFFKDEFNMAFFDWWLWLPMPVLEAFLLATWGTTPGKALMGMQVRFYTGRKLPFSLSLRRSFYVFCLGLGMMATPFTLLFLLFSWWYTHSRGFSIWDRRLGSVVEMKDAEARSSGRPGRIVMLFVLSFLILQILGVLMMPWMPELQAELSRMGF